MENVVGTIMMRIHDFNNDGFMVIAAICTGDEKIMIFFKDGKGDFRGHFTKAA